MKNSIWLSVDPMAGKYPNVTPYNYCENNPVKYIDPNGKEKLPFFYASEKGIIEAVENFKDDGAIHIFAHGNSGGLTLSFTETNSDGTTVDREQRIESPEEFANFLNTYSETWQNKGDNEAITIVLHSCNTGENGGFAEKISGSEGFENVTIYAPDQKIVEGKRESSGKHDFFGIGNETKNTDGTSTYSAKGNWRSYKGGNQVRVLSPTWQPKEKPTFMDNLKSFFDQ